jgi:hypothetical protein
VDFDEGVAAADCMAAMDAVAIDKRARTRSNGYVEPIMSFETDSDSDN